MHGRDIVLWHSFGITQVVRPEDFPVMPAEVVGFVLQPVGFFFLNPAIDLPPGEVAGSTCRNTGCWRGGAGVGQCKGKCDLACGGGGESKGEPATK